MILVYEFFFARAFTFFDFDFFRDCLSGGRCNVGFISKMRSIVVFLFGLFHCFVDRSICTPPRRGPGLYNFFLVEMT